MRFQAITQLVLIVIAIIMIVTVIRPKFVDVQAVQQDVEEYERAVTTARQLNSLITEKQSRIENISITDRNALSEYLPEEIDALSVARDIATISTESDMTINGIEVGEVETPTGGEQGGQVDFASTNSSADPAMDSAMETEFAAEEQHQSQVGPTLNDLSRQEFSVSVAGSYDSMKDFLRALERNHYPLRVTALSFGESANSDGGETASGEAASPGDLSISLTIATYAYNGTSRNQSDTINNE